MKYYLEYKNREEFDKLTEYYKDYYGYIRPSECKIPPGFIIENNILEWKHFEKYPPADAKKITFKEWEEMINPKLKWEKGAYVRYLGTKKGETLDEKWEKYFNTPGLKAGDVGIINVIYNNNSIFIRDAIRESTDGVFCKKDLQLITKEEYEAGLRDPNKTYDFNEGDLVVIMMLHGAINWNDRYTPNKQGEILKLGGKYWGKGNCTIKDVNAFTSIPFISKISPAGDAYEKITGLKFRHATPEEIAYYNTIGLGANINDMKKPFNIDTYIPKGELIGVPNDIIKVMLQRQVEQGNPEDVTVFEKNNNADRDQNGFYWSNTIEGDYIWNDVIVETNFKSFYEFHKSKSDSDWKIAIHTDDKRISRPHLIDYLLSLHQDATNKHNLTGQDCNRYYYLDSKLNIGAYSKVLDNYKVIEEKDLPNYPKTSHNSPLNLKFVVKHSKIIGRLFDKIVKTNIYEKTSFTYICYPHYNNSHLYNTVPSGYVEISEQEAIDRLNAIISIYPVIPSEAFNKIKEQPNKIITIKKQSLTEQLCKIIEKEPDNIPVTSIFPEKRKSIINELKF